MPRANALACDGKDAGNSNRSRSSAEQEIRVVSSLNDSERSRQQAPQQETPTTGRQTPSAVTPYVIKRKMPEFQIASVLQTMDTLTTFLH
jgi:hypothetical protein